MARKRSNDATRPRPVDITDPAVFTELEERILIGETILSICSDQQMPSIYDVYKLLNEGGALGERILRARMTAQEAEIDKTIDIADAATINNWQVAALRIKTRQWRAEKLNPRRYGELLSLDAKQETKAITRVIIVNDPDKSTDGRENIIPGSSFGTEDDL